MNLDIRDSWHSKYFVGDILYYDCIHIFLYIPLGGGEEEDDEEELIVVVVLIMELFRRSSSAVKWEEGMVKKYKVKTARERRANEAQDRSFFAIEKDCSLNWSVESISDPFLFALVLAPLLPVSIAQ